MSEKIKESPDDAVAQESENFKREQLINELAQKRSALYEADEFGFHRLINDYTEELMKHFPNYTEYKLFHLLVGSTIDDEKSPFFDFPGEHSIERFLNLDDEERRKFVESLKKEIRHCHAGAE